jgi:pyrroloquinoline quinone (PQQ) biosynthesis protein C
MTTTHSERLRNKIELVLPDFISASTEVITHPRFVELYPELLIAIHQMIRTSVPLMQTSLNRCQELARCDRVAEAMIPYLTQHIKEELHHDEWLLEDIELLGIQRAEVLRRMPSPHVAAATGCRYYWILHHHPLAEIGAIAVMEGYPPAVEVFDILEEETGLPRAVFRTLEKHAHLDPHHRDDLLAAIDALPLEEEHHEILTVSAFATIEYASAVYREVAARLPRGAELLSV